MLQYTTVLPTTLELLKKLMQQKCLANFNLVGGTALALQLGHRFSIDLDLFTLDPFQAEDIIVELQKEFKFDIVVHRNYMLILNVEYPQNSN